MWIKRLKRIFAVLTVIALLIFGAAIWAGYHFRGEIVPIVTGELNKQLKTPVHVDTIRVTFLKHFPKASVEFDQVTVKGSNSLRKNDTLFYLEQLYLSFNLIDLYNGKFILSEVEANDGFVRMHVSELGVSNFDFWERRDTGSTSFSVEPQKIKLKNIDFDLSDEEADRRFSAQVNSLTGKGNFTDEESSVAVYGGLRNKVLRIHDINYIPDEILRVDVGMELNPSKDLYRLSRGHIILRDRYKFKVNGLYAQNEYEWNFKGSDLDIGVAAALIPDNVTEFFNDFKGSGKLNFSGVITKDQAVNRPDFKSTFELSKGALNLKEHELDIRDLYLTGTYADDLKHNAGGQLNIDSLHCLLNNEPFTGNLKVGDFQTPRFKLYAEHSNTLGAYQKYVEHDTLQKVDARFLLRANLSGKLMHLDSITLDDFIGFDKKIAFDFFDFDTEIRKSPYSVSGAAGSARLEKNDVFIDSLRGKLQNKPFKVKGTWRNALRYISGDEKFFRLFGSANFDSVVFNELFPEDPEDSAAFSLPEDLILDVTPMYVKSFKYNEIVLSRMSGHLMVRPGKIQIEDIKAGAIDGKLNGDLIITSKPGRVKADGRITDGDLSLLFKQMRDFGSKELTHNHLKGRLTADFTMSSPLLKSGDWDSERLQAVAEMTIKKGELIDYKPLQNTTSAIKESRILRTLIKLEDFERRLKHVRFEELSNTVKVRDGTFFLPETEIKSSALDIVVGGEQKFTGEIDYALNFNIKEVLQKKKVTETQYGYIQHEQDGGKRIFLKIGGTTDEPDVKLDRKRSRAHSKQELENEIKTTKSILKDEFGLFKADTSVPEIDDTPKKQEMRIEFDPEGGSSKEQDKSPDENQKDNEETPKSRFFDRLKDKVSSDPEPDKGSEFDDWEFEDDDF